jgi:glycosyltransferase involved in cell wall biosynthesis
LTRETDRGSIGPLMAMRTGTSVERPARARPILELAVPVHNEARVLDAAVRRLHDYLSQHFPFAWAIVIVDNASTDETFAVALELADALRGVRALHIVEKGRGGALRAAWMRSDAEVVAYTDVDLSTGLDALLPLVAPLVSGHSDLAIGSRLMSAAKVARGPKREVISRAYNLLLRIVFASTIHDAQCGFKAMRADVARRLVPAVVNDGWFFDTELLLLAEHNGLRVHEVAVDWTDDPDSRVNIRRTAFEDVRGMLRMAWRFATGRGRLELDDRGDRRFEDDMGRRLITFAIVGTVSTVASLVVFVGLRYRVGPAVAVVLALAATTAGNSWAHRHWTLGQRGRSGLVRHAVASGAIAACGIGASVLAVVVVDAIGGGILGELGALAVVWSATTQLRLKFLSRHSR